MITFQRFRDDERRVGINEFRVRLNTYVSVVSGLGKTLATKSSEKIIFKANIKQILSSQANQNHRHCKENDA